MTRCVPDSASEDVAVLATQRATIHDPSVSIAEPRLRQTTTPAALSTASAPAFGSHSSAASAMFTHSRSAGLAHDVHDQCTRVVRLAPSGRSKRGRSSGNALPPTTQWVSVDAVDAGQGASVA